MNNLCRLSLCAIVCVLVYTPKISAQEITSTYDRVAAFPDKLLHKINHKSASLKTAMDRQTERYLQKMCRHERKLKKKLFKIDSLAAKSLFNGTSEKYVALAEKMKQVSSKDMGNGKGEYLPYLDSIKGALLFLNKNPSLLAAGADVTDKLKDINLLQNSLGQTTEVSTFLKERKQLIGEALKKYTKLPKGITKNYQELNKEVYYYQAQIRAYKEMLNDPDKIEQAALRLLNKLPAFEAFMKQNSFLASMFRVPANYGSTASLAGLQTRDQVQQLIGNQLASGGPNAQEVLQQNLQGAQAQLGQLKEKINQLGGGSGEIEMPDFKPQSTKTKTFLQRLEYGTNLQTVKSNQYFPNTCDISFQLGYKLNDKSVAGIGSSYKLGIGKDIRHIAFSHQGIGLRSFLDYKIKGNFWLSGGAEMNYRSRFDDFQVLKDYSAWQQSALIGISKKYQVSKKVKGNAQVLYDALWKQQVPRTQPVVFRTGFNFK